jgi:hypothetical protein
MPDVLETLRTHRGGIRSVLLLHLEHDPSDYVTDQLRSAIEASGILDLQDRSVGEKIRTMFGFRHPNHGDRNRALAVAAGAGAQGVLLGTVHKHEAYGNGAVLDMEITFADVASGEPVFTKRFTEELTGVAPTVAAVEEHVQKVGPATRLLGWLLVVLLLPVFTIQFIRAMVRKESNGANAFVLAIYTVADAILAWLMVGASFDDWLPIVGFLVAIGTALAYNIFVMTFALRLEGGGAGE